MRCLERLFRRAGLALAMSQGFHPKPRVTFPLALAVGIEGLDEVMELELTETPAADELLRLLSRQAPPGLVFRSLEVLATGSRKARPRSAVYQAMIPAPRRAGLEERIGRLWAASSWPWQRPRRRAMIDLRADLESLSLQAGMLQMRLRGARRPRRTARRVGRPGAGRRRAARRSSDPHRSGDRRMIAPQRSGSRLASCRPPMRACRSCRTRKREHEKRDSDQRFPTGGMPDCDR